MERNQRGGYKLIDSGEVHAALWTARAAGDDDLAEIILSGATYATTEDSRLTKQVDLGSMESDRVIGNLALAINGRIDVHPSYIEDAHRMLDTL